VKALKERPLSAPAPGGPDAY
jgi:chromosome segregation ATPase